MAALTDLFIIVARMSLKAIPVILVLFFLRALLCRAPKVYSYALWAVAAFRLLCPVAPGSGLSLFNASPSKTGETLPRVTALPSQTQVQAPTQTTVPEFTAPSTVPAADPAAATQTASIDWQAVLALIWIAGVAAVLLYTAVRLWQLRRRTRCAVHLEDNIWLCDEIPGPFVFGLIRPKIFLPVWLEGEPRSYVLAHERCHVKRRDPWAKALGQLILALHWFNPAVWLMLRAVDRDMELSCDEGALKSLGREHSKDYSRTLLSLAARRRDFGPVLAFGTPAVKQRILHVLNFRKAGKATVALALAVLMIAGLTCCTDAKVEQQEGGDYTQRLWEARTEYVGANSAVSHLVGIILEPEDCYRDSMELYTDEAPYGIHLNLTWEKDYDTLREDSEAFLRSQFRAGVLLLALVDNLDYVEISACGLSDAGGETEFAELFRYPALSVEAAEVLLGLDNLKFYAETPAGIEKLLEALDRVNVPYATLQLLESNYTVTENSVIYRCWQDEAEMSMLILQTEDTAGTPVFVLTDDNLNGFAYGLWSETEGVITCTANDGRVYRFNRVDADNVTFSAGDSAPLNVPDRAAFQNNTIFLGDAVIEEPVERMYKMECTQWQESDHFVPRVMLRSDGTFTFNHSFLSSQFLAGTYEEADGYLTLTSDGGLVWHFNRINPDVIRFVAEGSSPLDQYADFDLLVEDGANFQAISMDTEYLMEDASFDADPRVMPSLRLYSDGSFEFFTSALLDRGFSGTYEVADGLLTLHQHSSTDVWQFRRIDESTLQFIAEGSSDLGQVPEYDVPIEDGALFTAQLYPIP